METDKILKRIEDHTILIVDDDSFITKLLVKALGLNGFFNISTAETNEEALRLLGTGSSTSKTTVEGGEFDMLICDVVLPGCNGFDICRKVRQESPSTSIIMMSGYDIEDINHLIVDSDADDFILKPFNPIELVTRVRMLIEKKNKISEQVEAPKLLLAPQRNFSLPYVGDRIGGYIIVDFIGWGKTSVLYKVICPTQNSIYALKMLTRNASEVDSMAKRFENEIEIMSKVSHPNIIKFVDNGFFNKSHYLVKEYVDGMDLEEYLITRGKPDEDALWQISYEMAGGLLELHSKGIMHRDIKLKNILYAHKEREIKIGDFGIARLPDSLRMTKDGFVLGTPLYMAPEIFNGENATFRSEIYSYGATLYHLACGSPPFTADTSSKLYEQIRNRYPLPISSFRNDLPEWWNTMIVGQCLSKEAESRPESFREIIKILESRKKR